jgi:hypothetical protein
MSTMLPSGVTHPARFVPGSLFNNATFMALLVRVVNALPLQVGRRTNRVTGTTSDGPELYFEYVPNQDPTIGASRTSASMTLFAEAIGIAHHPVNAREVLSPADLAAIDALLSEEALFNCIQVGISQYLLSVVPAANRGPQAVLPPRPAIAAYCSDRAYEMLSQWRQYQLADKTDMVALPRSPIADTQFQLGKMSGIPVFGVGPLRKGRETPVWGVVSVPATSGVSSILRLSPPGARGQMINYAVSAADLIRQAYVSRPAVGTTPAARDVRVVDYIAALEAFPGQANEATAVKAQLDAWWTSRSNNPADPSRAGGVDAAKAFTALTTSTMGNLFDTWITKSPEFAWPFATSLLVPLTQELESIWLAYIRYTLAICESVHNEIVDANYSHMRGHRVVADMSCPNQGIYELVNTVPTSSVLAGEVLDAAALASETGTGAHSPITDFRGPFAAYLFKGDLGSAELLADALIRPVAVVPPHKAWRDAALCALPSTIRTVDGGTAAGLLRGRETLAMNLMHMPTGGSLGPLVDFLRKA